MEEEGKEGEERKTGENVVFNQNIITSFVFVERWPDLR